MKKWILFCIALHITSGNRSDATCDETVFKKPKNYLTQSVSILGTELVAATKTAYRIFREHPRIWTIVVASLVLRPRCDVQGRSMEPTLNDGQIIMIDRLSMWWSAPQRGEIIVFEHVDQSGRRANFVKRVIGVPGDRIKYERGWLTINEVAISEDYLDPVSITYFRSHTQETVETVVPDDHIWVLGDNRSLSLDSRDIGPVPVDHCFGRVMSWSYSR